MPRFHNSGESSPDKVFERDRRLTLYRDVRPDQSIFGIDVEPLFESRLGVRFNRVDRALRLANTAIDAFVRVDDEHVLTLIEAVDRTYLDTVHVLTFDTAFIDDVGQLSLLPASISVVEFLRASSTVSGLREGVRRVTCVAASVQSAHIHDRGIGALSFDL
jgi:hypothetical protein